MPRFLKHLSVCLLALALTMSTYPGSTATDFHHAPPDPQSMVTITPPPEVKQPEPADDPAAIVPSPSTPAFARPNETNAAPDEPSTRDKPFAEPSQRPTPTPKPLEAPEDRLALASTNTSTELSSKEKSEYRGLVKKVFGMEAADKRLAFEYVRRLSPVELMQVAVWFIRNTRETKALLYNKLEQHFTKQEIRTMEQLVHKYDR